MLCASVLLKEDEERFGDILQRYFEAQIIEVKYSKTECSATSLTDTEKLFPEGH